MVRDTLPDDDRWPTMPSARRTDAEIGGCSLRRWTVSSKLLFLIFGLAGSFWIGTAGADPVSGRVFVTTENPEPDATVWSATYNFNGAALTWSRPTKIGRVPPLGNQGSKALLFLPNNNLAVGQDGAGILAEITTGGNLKATVTANGNGNLALGPPSTLGRVLYDLAGDLTAFPLLGGGLPAAGTPYSITCSAGCSTAVSGLVFDPRNNTWYYTARGGGGEGEFGTVDLNDASHTAKLTRLATDISTNSLSFDPFTNDLIAAGDTIQQLDVTGKVLSSIGPSCGSVGFFLQATVDGKGHLLATEACGLGDLGFVDYAASGLIGAAENFTAANFSLEGVWGIAPLSGFGSVPEPTSVVLLCTGLLGFGLLRRRLTKA